ncbi:hypothetical protein evm_010819 [Chilo suppressalis]|nr:hypothetical protein evm_010819 [Chilo suppressalis]
MQTQIDEHSMIRNEFILQNDRKVVNLKKVNSKYILKSTLTPRLARKEMQKELQNSSPQLTKSRSCSSLNQNHSTDPAGPAYNNYLTVHSFPSTLNLPTITTQSFDDLITSQGMNKQHHDDSEDSEPPTHHTWTTMTPQEIATWIDKRSRPINVPTAGAQAFPMDGIGRLGHDPPRGPSADWWVLTTADAAGTNGLTCLPKHGAARDSNFWSPTQ